MQFLVSSWSKDQHLNLFPLRQYWKKIKGCFHPHTIACYCHRRWSACSWRCSNWRHSDITIAGWHEGLSTAWGQYWTNRCRCTPRLVCLPHSAIHYCVLHKHKESLARETPCSVSDELMVLQEHRLPHRLPLRPISLLNSATCRITKNFR